MLDLRTIPFWKMHAFGNDFVLIDCLDNNYPITDSLIKRILDRKFGIGADDLILLSNSTKADYKMKVMNPDGSEAPMCGNALLCVGKYIYSKSKVCPKHWTIETFSGIRTITPINEENQLKLRLSMGKPNFNRASKEIFETVKVGAEDILFVSVNTGAPHAVVFVNNLDDYPVSLVGKQIEHHPRFPDTTNVMFVLVEDYDSISIRCWERGGTGESLACGTGACASAYISTLLNYTRNSVRVKFQIGEAKVWIEDDNEISLTGQAEFVYSGQWETRNS
ncbi:diaminopimelate epimerase [Bacillus mycoides]|uniref:diaminopimelate epimerase n=1 Tax=Bacillus mycoides TaxID=1405 RepID=UPI003D230DD9